MICNIYFTRQETIINHERECTLVITSSAILLIQFVIGSSGGLIIDAELEEVFSTKAVFDIFRFSLCEFVHVVSD
jgi:hypothetical protein